MKGAPQIDWQNVDSVWHAHPSNHRLVPGGSEYGRYLWVKGQIAPGSRVLDVGCNCGQLAVNLTNDLGCHVVGIDIVAEFVRHCQEEKARFGRFLCADFSRMTPEEIRILGLFDVVTALEVIEHPIDVQGFRENVRRVLRPGGRLVITTPHPDGGYGYTYKRAHPHHVRMWTPWRLEMVFGPMVVYEEIHLKDGQLAQMGAVFKL